MSGRAVPIVLTGIAAGLVLGIAATALADRTYRATAILQASPAPDPRVLEPGSRPLAAEVLAETYADLLSAPGFLAQVAPLVDAPAGDLEDRVGARRPEGSALVELTADAPSRASAEELAAGVADAFLSLVRQLERQRAESVRAELGRRTDELTQRISRLRRRGAAETDERVVALRGRRSAVDVQLAAQAASGSSLSFVAGPAGSSERVRPQLVQNVLGGVVLGLVGALGAAFLPWRRAKAELRAEAAPEAVEVPAAAEEELAAEPPTPPSVSILVPSPGAVVRGRTALLARASDSAMIRFLVSDGSPAWTAIAEAPPGRAGAEWDTAALPDGRYWLSAVATNGAGLSAATDPIPVAVQNGP